MCISAGVAVPNILRVDLEHYECSCFTLLLHGFCWTHPSETVFSSKENKIPSKGFQKFSPAALNWLDDTIEYHKTVKFSMEIELQIMAGQQHSALIERLKIATFMIDC